MQLSQSNRPNTNTLYYHRYYPHNQDPASYFASQPPFADQLTSTATNNRSTPAWRARNAAMTTTSTVEINPSGAVSYCLDRGNGQFTRLIPADLLPPLSDIPPRESKAEGMYVLPSLALEPDFMKRPIRIKSNSPERPGSLSSSPSRKNKIYCDKWIHEGTCAFTQQGCKFKHEMPHDESTQRSLGLFQGLPAWWKKRNEDNMNMAASGSCSRFPSPAPDGNGGFQKVPTRPGTPIRQPYQPAPNRSHGSSPDQGSQWLRNGIVPFVRGPMRYGHQRASTMTSWHTNGNGNGSGGFQGLQPRAEEFVQFQDRAGAITGPRAA